MVVVVVVGCLVVVVVVVGCLVVVVVVGCLVVVVVVGCLVVVFGVGEIWEPIIPSFVESSVKTRRSISTLFTMIKFPFL